MNKPILQSLIDIEGSVAAFCETYQVERSSVYRWLDGTHGISLRTAERITNTTEVDTIELMRELQVGQ